MSNEQEQNEEIATQRSDETSQQSDRTEDLESQVADLRDQLLRRTAEMDNMRRRFNQERDQLIFEGNKRLLNDLLSTVDDLERTLEFSNSADSTLAAGVELVYKNIVKLLERYGVQAMQTEGEAFDFNKHDALLNEVREDVEPGTILKEVQKGYLLNDKVLRHAKVVVAKQAD